MTVIKPVLIRSGSLQLHFCIDLLEQQLLKDINELQHGHIEVNLKNIDQCHCHCQCHFICHALVASFFCPLSSSGDFSLLQVSSPIKSWSQVSGIGS